jgi:plastocyanin
VKSLGARLLAAAAVASVFTAAYRERGGPSTPSAAPPTEAAAAAIGWHGCPAAAGLDGSVADHGTVEADDSAVAVTADDSYFEPTCESGVRAGEVKVQVRNTGRLLHNISFEDLGIDQDIGPGETVTVRVKMGKEPRRFSCKYHRGAGMVGALLPR